VVQLVVHIYFFRCAKQFTQKLAKSFPALFTIDKFMRDHTQFRNSIDTQRDSGASGRDSGRDRDSARVPRDSARGRRDRDRSRRHSDSSRRDRDSSRQDRDSSRHHRDSSRHQSSGVRDSSETSSALKTVMRRKRLSERRVTIPSLFVRLRRGCTEIHKTCLVRLHQQDGAKWTRILSDMVHDMNESESLAAASDFISGTVEYARMLALVKAEAADAGLAMTDALFATLPAPLSTVALDDTTSSAAHALAILQGAGLAPVTDLVAPREIGLYIYFPLLFCVIHMVVCCMWCTDISDDEDVVQVAASDSASGAASGAASAAASAVASAADAPSAASGAPSAAASATDAPSAAAIARSNLAPPRALPPAPRAPSDDPPAPRTDATGAPSEVPPRATSADTRAFMNDGDNDVVMTGAKG